MGLAHNVLKHLSSDPIRIGLDTNNDTDASTVGLTKGLNISQYEYYFSLSTLAKSTQVFTNGKGLTA